MLKAKSLFQRFSLSAGALLLLIAAAYGQPEKESVVLVFTEQDAGYGVAWQQPDNIVTALHIVAGRAQILVRWKNGKESPATIKKIDKAADLALLQLQKPLGVPALEIYQGDPPFDRPLNYWEAPEANGMFRMDRQDTRLNAEKRAIPLRQFDNRIASEPQKLAVFQKALCADGPGNYPSLNTSVFKFEERKVGKSHSGSPITYNGKIVGMVDGGQPIGGKACVWAIPAAGNFKNLPASAAALPKQSCSAEKLYGGLRKDNPLLRANKTLSALADTLAFYARHRLEFADGSNDKLCFTLNYRSAFQDIYDTMFAEDQKEVRELLEDEESSEEGPVTLKDLLGQAIDMFQDDATGATIAVPSMSKIRIEKSPTGGHNFLRVSVPGSNVEMIVLVEKTGSKAAAEEARRWYEDYIVSDGREWEKEKGVDDEVFSADDPDEPYFDKLMDRVVYGDDEEIVAELYASITIEENNFLGVTIKVNNPEELTKTQRLQYYLMEACAILSDFAYY